MNKKFIISGLAGGVAYFLLGGLVYGKLLTDVMKGWEGSTPIPMKDPPDMLPLIFGNMFIAFLLAHIFTKWANIRSLNGGFMGGLTVGLFMSAGYDLIFYGTSNAYNFTGIIMDIIVGTLMMGLVGAVVGFVLSKME